MKVNHRFTIQRKADNEDGFVEYTFEASAIFDRYGEYARFEIDGLPNNVILSSDEWQWVDETLDRERAA